MRRQINQISLLLNILCIIYPILRIYYPNQIIEIIATITIPFTLLLNYFIVYLYNFKRLKAYKYPRIFLKTSIIGLLMIIAGNFLKGASYSSQIKQTWHIWSIIYIGYYSIFISAIYNNIKTLGYNKYFIKINNSKKNIIKNLISLIYILIIIAITIITYTKIYVSTIEMIIPELSITFAIITIPLGLLIYSTNPKSEINKKISVIFIIIFSILLTIPLIANLTNINKIDLKFSNTFGNQQNSKFRKVHFSFTDYLLGIKIPEIEIKKDITYYKDTKGYENNIELKFDAYIPKNKNKENPVIIRIHGGSWVGGNKGFYNMLQINKYFASQGYTVFDIQYGLTNTSIFSKNSEKIKNRTGNFTIDDMIKHIGYFTKYLEQNKQKYNADTSKVIISGGSSGGQLATAIALSYENEKYKNWYDQNIKIKGIIPLYPAYTIASKIGIEGEKELISPEKLINKNNIPILIYQGTKDTFVPEEIIKQFEKKYSENNKIMTIYFPYSGHANDIYFEGYYNQIFLYYMERFIQYSISK